MSQLQKGGLLRPVLVLLVAGVLGLVSAAGPLEVIDAMGKLKGKEEVKQFMQKRLKATDRGERDTVGVG